MVSAVSINRFRSSSSNSSSLHNSNGFFAPPMAVLADTSLIIVSSIFVLKAPPAGLSKYCFMKALENPRTPPK